MKPNKKHAKSTFTAGLITGLSAIALFMSGCQQPPGDPPQTSATEPANQVESTLAGSPEHLLNDITTLSSDAFAGRAPMSAGETKTLDFIQQRFTDLGLQPLFGDAYRQPVPLAEISTDPSASFTVKVDDQQHSFSYGDDVMLWSTRTQTAVDLAQAELVFAGYGIVAPEFNWDDYAGLDVAGKIVVVLVNDPGFATSDSKLFQGRTMTYYGRWTYKFEEAARQGAAGALIVHNSDAASYPWAVVKNSWSGPQFHLEQRANKSTQPSLAVSGWISENSMARLLMLMSQQQVLAAAANSQTENSADADPALTLDELYQTALQPDFNGIALNLQADISLHQSIRYAQSYNIGARSTGSKSPEETIIYMAHWDHLGTDAAAAEGEDAIYNGAVDNATGIAALLSLAEAFSQQPAAPRSVAFLAVTAEESGLLGSAWYAQNPPVPMAQHVAGINMDALNVYGPTADLVVVGYGKSEMEDYLRKYAQQQERIVAPEERPEAGGFYRSDHFNFAKQGVPMLYADSGSNHIEHGAAWLLEKQQRFTAERYHKPQDEVQDDWDLRGMQQDIWLFQQIGQDLANSTVWPSWYEGTEFRQIRQASRAAAN
ncbi:MAG: M28 family metallopeptidase [Gammaproteobacteria bacterium]|nr:M28 family metallopeptidase [Gammaproteobacteria bacterium]